MTLKVGDEVVITASNRQLRYHSCEAVIKTGGTFTIESVRPAGGYYLADAGRCNHIKESFVKLSDPYVDEDWV